jgi:hypothetical protein
LPLDDCEKPMSQPALRGWTNGRRFAVGLRIGLLLHAMPALAATLPASETQNAPVRLANAAAPTFDMAAARSSARELAREDRKSVAAPVLRLEATGPRTNEQIQQRLEQARRGNCLKANESMNLLANVVMLARDIVATAVDDSGCNW